ncbi:MAG: Elongation factor P--(R)-beta-lysine ligase [Chlamydiae bacterium]|nr:Elongation factor P--(R)-beta-lysine ligase [Chlamydiota bacterium]
MSMSPAQINKRLERLKVRAVMLAKSRSFFHEREVIEVDAPALNTYANLDDHIDPIAVSFREKDQGYLHTSPEPFLKKLLAQGFGDLYFLGHVFRDHEYGNHHQIEFTMVEWYRQKLSFESLIKETLEYIYLFIRPKTETILSYQEALFRFTGLNSNSSSREELIDYVHKKIDKNMSFGAENRDDLLSFIFAHEVEPQFNKEEITIIKGYPRGQAALAKTEWVGNEKIARRFEIYHQGLELANGYDELVGSDELSKRYEELNQKRTLFGKKKLKIDDPFVQGNATLPGCCGVSVGFDRLMMLNQNTKYIQDVIAMI